jgi:hypothetical protein
MESAKFICEGWGGDITETDQYLLVNFEHPIDLKRAHEWLEIHKYQVSAIQDNRKFYIWK